MHHASHQGGLNVGRCKLGSHNYETDSSHEDVCIQFNANVTVDKSNDKKVVDNDVSCPSDIPELQLPGEVLEADDTKTLIMEAPYPATHFLGIDIELRDHSAPSLGFH